MRPKFIHCLWLALVSFAAISCRAATSYVPANVTLPPVPREFRAAWIATVGNSVWPSKPGLSVAEQKAEMITLLDAAARLNLNAIIFQVRPACDALYVSKIEPWSEYLTGTMGQPPAPLYDPLEFAITEAHKRGLELHAWFNPYRAHHFNAKSPIASSHVSKTKPHLVRKYGRYLWLDPGEREVQEYSLSVVMDVVRRYNVDGIHFDDYFYPYAERGGDGRDIEFPDDASWQKFGARSGLSRDDWRRENVNRFVERVYKSIKAEEPEVKFGISPFGIWRPGHPPQIKGLDAYDRLYADARKWLASGWVDYFAPQLYWSIEQREQSFPVLLNWWNEQNPKRRHIWPGLNTTKLHSNRRPDGSTPPNWPPMEIEAQIRLAARQPVSAGHIHWNLRALTRSTDMMLMLQRGHYAQPALVPACDWLAKSPPPRPQLRLDAASAVSAKFSWDIAPTANPARWVLQCQRGGNWTTRLLPGEQRSVILDGDNPDVVALTAVNRAGNFGPVATLAAKKSAVPNPALSPKKKP